MERKSTGGTLTAAEYKELPEAEKRNPFKIDDKFRKKTVPKEIRQLYDELKSHKIFLSCDKPGVLDVNIKKAEKKDCDKYFPIIRHHKNELIKMICSPPWRVELDRKELLSRVGSACRRMNIPNPVNQTRIPAQQSDLVILLKKLELREIIRMAS